MRHPGEMVAPALGLFQRRIPVFVDQDSGQFNNLAITHLMYVKQGVRQEVPAPGGPGSGFSPLPKRANCPGGRRAANDPRVPAGRFRGQCMDLSVVIPVRNEAGNLAPLVAEIDAALAGLVHYEIVVVDDGSDDATAAETAALQPDRPHLHLVRHEASCGQSAAIRSGIKTARGLWIATLDGDGQNDPADIPKLWRLARDAPAEPPLLIAGHRARRRDRWSKRQASRIANAVRRRLLRDDTPDTGCGLKLFPRALFLDLPSFDHMHRFLPALVLRAGGAVRSVPVNHRPRQRGVSKYGIFDRLLVGITDLAGLMWLIRRSSRPVRIANPTSAEADAAPRAPVGAAEPVP